jgi:hypothetical protein
LWWKTWFTIQTFLIYQVSLIIHYYFLNIYWFNYFRRNNDDFNTQTRRLQPITNNNTHDIIQKNCRIRTPVDSFVQLNLKPSSIDIRLEDYKKVKYILLSSAVFFSSILSIQ